MIRCSRRLVLAALTVATPTLGTAQSPGSPERLVAAGERYEAGWLHRLIFGTRYRRIWATPVAVPLLDLDTAAGGLTPIRRGGFGQTRSLHLRGRDGRRYVFRSVDKDPTQGLPDELEGTFVDAVVQDQVSANHPYAALAVAPLLEAIGILHATPRLAVMPDDTRLGEHRAEFAGMLGMLEERPNEGPDDSPGFEGFTKIVQTETMFERLEDDPEHRVHAADFLTARLFDLYVGDRDRHTDQWRWAREDEGDRTTWRPIPRDRDQAFVMLDGVVMSVIRLYRPQFVGFGSAYPDIAGATFNGWGLDRRLLSGLEWSAWDSVVTAMQARLSDSVIVDAVRHLPPEVYRRDGASLVRILQERRDRLRGAAREYYALLARYVDIHATDRDEVAWVDRLPNGDVEVRIARDRRGRAPRPAYFTRRFAWRETREIRLYLHGGDDRVVVRGTVPQSLLVRVIGGGDDDLLADSSLVGRGRTRTFFYDGRDDNRFITGPGTRIDPSRPDPLPDDERFRPPPPPNAFDAPNQNWGGWWYPNIWLSLEPDLGLTVGGGPTIYSYGFRKTPYRAKLDIRAGYATGAERPRLRVDLEYPALSRTVGAEISLRTPAIGVTHFHGFGNASPSENSAPDDLFEVGQLQYSLSPALSLRLARTVRLRVAIDAKVVASEPPASSLLGSTRPLGVGTFGQVGGRIGLMVDTRDVPTAAQRGVLLSVEGTIVPALIDVPQTFGKVRGEARTYLTAANVPTRPTLALRATGERVFGAFPFFEGAFIGGAETLRGFRRGRFVGDAAVLGNAELRLALARVKWIVRGDLGVFGLVDAGRVFLDGESSSRWHHAEGGGVWWAPISRANTLSLAVAASEERTGVYFTAGFMF